MAFREVTMLEVKEVLRQWLLGVPKRRVAEQLGLDVKTVRRYLAAARAQGVDPAHGVDALTDALVSAVVAAQGDAGRPRGDGWAVCDEHRSFIEGHLEDGVRLTKVCKLLKRQGLAVQYQTLRRYALEQLQFGQAKPTVPVADCEPGAEVQLDTGWMTMLEANALGRRRRFRAWIFTAVRSRHRFVFPVERETTESGIEACEAAWEFYGGVFKAVIVDNTKAIVASADALEPRLVQGFLEYSQARGFVVDTTRVRRPKDKARVERSVQTVRDDCFAGERLRSVTGDARERAHHWCLHEYGERVHSTTQRRPREHFEAEERAALLPPPVEPYDVPLWCDPKVAPDQFAQVAKGLYSLPLVLRGKRLRARADRQLVRFWHHGELVKTHPRVGPGRRSIDPADFPAESLATAQRDGAYWTRRAAEHGEHVGRYVTALLAGPAPWTRMRQVHKLVGLAERYGSNRLDAACRTALDAAMVDVQRLERLVRLDTRLNPPPAQVIPLARYLRPASQYALPLKPERLTEGEEP